LEKALTTLLRASQTPAPPKIHEWVLTSWEVEIDDSPLSRGGFGEVSKGIWLGHTLVAVKRLLIRLETNKLKDDFYREVKTWYPLRHPHILPLLGACATAERPFMVSPFMKAGHALMYLEKYEDLSEGKWRRFQLLYEVSQGMQYLHSRNVIHGDLKAVNVLVNEHGRSCVADFGFATLKKITSTRFTSSTNPSHSSTSTSGGNQIAGTLRWMAPERLMGGPLTPAVDVYAFGMTCYEILTEGEIPLTSKYSIFRLRSFYHQKK
jgi:serine/threonine protein kinase